MVSLTNRWMMDVSGGDGECEMWKKEEMEKWEGRAENKDQERAQTDGNRVTGKATQQRRRGRRDERSGGSGEGASGAGRQSKIGNHLTKVKHFAAGLTLQKQGCEEGLALLCFWRRCFSKMRGVG